MILCIIGGSNSCVLHKNNIPLHGLQLPKTSVYQGSCENAQPLQPFQWMHVDKCSATPTYFKPFHSPLHTLRAISITAGIPAHNSHLPWGLSPPRSVLRDVSALQIVATYNAAVSQPGRCLSS